MQGNAYLALLLAQERRASEMRDADNARRAREARHSQRQPLRRALGHGLMRFGAHLAADGARQPARAR